MPALLDQRANGLHRTFDDAADGDPFSAKLNPARGDAGDFEQVIHEMLKLSQLTFDDAAGLLLDRVLARPLETQQLHGVGDGSERAAQLVTEHRQELVLAAVQVRQLCLLDLPEPEGPSRHTVSPGATVNEMSSSTRRLP